MRMLRLQRLGRDIRGTSIIEAAIVIPIAIILFVGVLDFGRVYYTRATAQKSIRAAVRYLSTLPANGICTTTGAPSLWGVQKSKNLALYGNVDGTGSIRLKNWSSGNITVNSSVCPIAAGATVGISATVPFQALVWRYVGLPGSITLRVNYEAKWIGQ